MRLVIARSFVIASASLLIFGGAFIYWQQINQPSANGCYTFPFGFGALVQAYQGSCNYGAIPNYFASDVALSFILAGFALTLVRFNRKDVSVG